MTLHSSSNTQPQALLPTISTTDEPEVVLLDTPVNQKQPRKSKEDHSSPHAESEAAAAASPASVSAVIDALHLSDIDWEALSFTSSPAANHTAEPKLSKTTDGDVKETEGERKTSSDIREDSRSAPELCYTECPLRDRLLMKNTAKAVKEQNNDVSKQLNYEHISSHNSNGHIPSKLSGKEPAVYKKEPLTDKKQCATNNAETHSVKQQSRPAAQSKTKDKLNGSQKPPQKYKFVRKAVLPPQRGHSDPSPSDKDRNAPQTNKKSVCMSVCSSSEDSDAENQQQRKAKIKPVNKIKTSYQSDFSLKPKTTKPTVRTAPVLGPRSQSCSADVKINSISVAANSRCQDVSPALVDDDVFPQTPASPAVLDSDDSVVCSESPLPLAERLRLKFLK